MKFPGLTSAQVELRSFRDDDITDRHVRWLNDPMVVQFSNQRFYRHDLRSCRDYFRSFENTENLYVSIRLRSAGGAAVGTMTVYSNLHHGTADVGIMVGERSAQGRGVGREAWTLLLGWLLGEGGKRKVTAGTLDCNHAMIRLAEQSGMSCEGRRVAQELVDGKAHDILYYGKFKA